MDKKNEENSFSVYMHSYVCRYTHISSKEHFMIFNINTCFEKLNVTLVIYIFLYLNRHKDMCGGVM